MNDLTINSSDGRFSLEATEKTVDFFETATMLARALDVDLRWQDGTAQNIRSYDLPSGWADEFLYQNYVFWETNEAWSQEIATINAFNSTQLADSLVRENNLEEGRMDLQPGSENYPLCIVEQQPEKAWSLPMPDNRLYEPIDLETDGSDFSSLVAKPYLAGTWFLDAPDDRFYGNPDFSSFLGDSESNVHGGVQQELRPLSNCSIGSAQQLLASMAEFSPSPSAAGSGQAQLQSKPLDGNWLAIPGY